MKFIFEKNRANVKLIGNGAIKRDHIEGISNRGSCHISSYHQRSISACGHGIARGHWRVIHVPSVAWRFVIRLAGHLIPDRCQRQQSHSPQQRVGLILVIVEQGLQHAARPKQSVHITFRYFYLGFFLDWIKQRPFWSHILSSTLWVPNIILFTAFYFTSFAFQNNIYQIRYQNC